MSEPTVEANLGTVECEKFAPGHNVHWIPVLRVWAEEPRLPMTIRHITSNAFEITSEGKSEILYNHDPQAVVRAIKESDPKDFKLVGNTGAVTIESNRGHSWIYFTNEPFVSCDVPQPKYYDKFRYIDKEIARLEDSVINSPTLDQRVGAKVLLLKAQHIKKLQQENAHKTYMTVSGYDKACTCGLLLDIQRKIDEGVGHIDY